METRTDRAETRIQVAERLLLIARLLARAGVSHERMAERLAGEYRNVEPADAETKARLGRQISAHAKTPGPILRDAAGKVAAIMREAAESRLLDAEATRITRMYPSGGVSWFEYLAAMQRHYCGMASPSMGDMDLTANAIEAIARAVAQTNPAAGPVEPIKGLFSPEQLAERYGLPADAVRKRLERYRKHNLDGWVENVERKPREPQYTYDHDAVKHVLDGMVSQRTRRTKTSSERPAKKI